MFIIICTFGTDRLGGLIEGSGWVRLDYNRLDRRSIKRFRIAGVSNHGV
jgi:hypothetical protein